MELREYCQALLTAKSSFPTFGRAWVVGRLAIACLVCLLFAAGSVADPTVTSAGAFILLGYLLGTTLHDVRQVAAAKRKWALQTQLYDWEKIEKLAQSR